LKIKIVTAKSIREITNLKKFTLRDPILLIAEAKKYELTAHNMAVSKADISPKYGILINSIFLIF
jgi:hypothetical protein